MKDILNLTKDSLATLLICSNLAIDYKKETIKPYTVRQWNILVDKLMNSSMRRPSSFFETTEQDWARELYLNNEEIDRLNSLLSRAGQLGIELENLRNLGIQITTRAEKNYPKRLKSILKKDSPPIVFYCGDLRMLENKGIAMVGSRNIDQVGLDFTKTIAKKCVLEGFNIISGGAQGVDSAAEETALKLQGKVVSFIATSMVQKIKVKEVRKAIINGNLLLMSATNPKSGFRVYTAMGRNKYIYSLSNSAIVVSSDYNKGGTWAGAIENLKNNWVPMFVRRDDKIPEGNKELLNKGVHPIEVGLFTDKGVSISEYINSKINSSHNNEIMIQMDIESFINNKAKHQNYIIAKEDESSIEIKEDKKEDDVSNMNDAQVDIYNIVWPYIEKELIHPKNSEELSEIFKLKKSQVDEWLKRAVEEKKIKRLTRPVRYIISK
ncbi:MAG TPA: DNA-processing protein DprA [Thermoclostridium sp.]|nr:DNA-processing protein DprA [Thermoclostridium sp.]